MLLFDGKFSGSLKGCLCLSTVSQSQFTFSHQNLNYHPVWFARERKLELLPGCCNLALVVVSLAKTEPRQFVIRILFEHPFVPLDYVRTAHPANGKLPGSDDDLFHKRPCRQIDRQQSAFGDIFGLKHFLACPCWGRRRPLVEQWC